MLELDRWHAHRHRRQRIMGPWSFTSLILQSTKISVMGKTRSKVFGKVRVLIICRRSISRWCDLRTIVARDVLLVRAPVLAKHKSCDVGNSASWVIPKGIEIFWTFSASHEVKTWQKRSEARITLWASK